MEICKQQTLVSNYRDIAIGKVSGSDLFGVAELDLVRDLVLVGLVR